jgi:hypothetical protein
MHPVSNPIFSEIWKSCRSIVVCILFPATVAFLYLFYASMLMFYQLLRNEKMRRPLSRAKDFAYNGRRYRLSEIGPYYSEIQDEDQNILYYPTHDLNGLAL